MPDLKGVAGAAVEYFVDEGVEASRSIAARSTRGEWLDRSERKDHRKIGHYNGVAS